MVKLYHNMEMILFLFILFISYNQSNAEFKFSEELYIKTLNDLNVNFHFEFKSTWNENGEQTLNSCKISK
jgi:hypothetical protein